MPQLYNARRRDVYLSDCERILEIEKNGQGNRAFQGAHPVEFVPEGNSDFKGIAVNKRSYWYFTSCGFMHSWLMSFFPRFLSRSVAQNFLAKSF